MPKTLAELRANPAPRPERAYSLCLAPHLVAEVQSLTDELSELEMSGEDAEQDGPPPRAGDPAVEAKRDRKQEIRARLGELLEEMADYEGELRVRAVKSDGEWRQWVNANPARPEDSPEHKRDMAITFGYCNADALIDDLATYAWTWNSERLADGDWATLDVGTADKKKIATTVVAMYESDLNLPSWRRALSSNLRQGAYSNSPATSESLSDAS